eukprot:2179152-Amphidinium_carterae.1
MYAAIAERLPGSLFDASAQLALKVKHCVMDRGIAAGVAQYMSGQWRRSSGSKSDAEEAPMSSDGGG